MIRSIQSISAMILLVTLLAPVAAICIDHDHCCKDLACTNFLDCCCKAPMSSTAPVLTSAPSIPDQVCGACPESALVVVLSGDLPGPDHPPRFTA